MFSFFILGFLWTFQVLFLNQYYKYVKIKDIKSVASTIKKKQSSSNLELVINNVAYEKGVCVEVLDQSFRSLYTSSFLGKGCFTGKEEQLQYKYNFISSGLEEATYELVNPKFDNQTLVYALLLDTGQYAFINTSLEPIDSTVGIIRNQLILVSMIVLLLSFVVAYFISRHISKPIVQINQAAKQLAKGNFDTVFDSGTQIQELIELSDTLNYTRNELSKTEQLRRDLMANVSHDLKTPLTMIKAYAEMSRDLHSNNKEKQKKDMNTIIEEVDRLTLLVHDILTLSSIQSEIEQLHYESFNLTHMIENIIQRYYVFQETEHYNFQFKHPKEDVFVIADRKKMEQVMYNLINNAIHYTGDDNCVMIRITKTDTILVEVIDTGEGIKPEDIPYIWDRYYKSEKKHKRNLIGTGLGLSIVKSILVSHHFEYGVYSGKDQGCNFYFRIPAPKKD